ncbi:SDR family NAD(P)-dependent oxidoreductase, partial [Streptomyces asiaticus]
AALRGQARALAAHTAAAPGLSPTDVGWSLVTTRSVFDHRAVVVGRGPDELRAGLAALAAGEPHPSVVGPGVARSGAAAPASGTVFAFGGEGGHPPGTGAGLYGRFPVFATAFDEVGEVLGVKGEADVSSRAGLFALYIALARLLASVGVRPDAVVGCGVGEIATAHITGALDLADACRLVATGADPGAVEYERPPMPSLDEAGAVWELGPGAMLPSAPAALVLSPFRGEGSEVRELMRGLARMHTMGATVDWAALFDGDPAPRAVALPTYAFQRQRYWLENEAQADAVPTVETWAEAEFWDAVERTDAAALTRALEVPAGRREALAELLPALATWRRQREWRHRIVWKPLPDPAAPRLTGTWLVVTSGDGEDEPMVAAVTTALRDHGAETVVFDPNTTPSLAGRPVVGVLSLLALDDARPASDDGRGPAMAPTVELFETLRRAGVEAPVWLATRGGVSVDVGDPMSRPEQAGFWGLGSALAMERPRCWGGLVDLPHRFDDRAGRRLVGVLAGAYGEVEVAVRGDSCFARRLVRDVPTAPATPARRLRGTVLITGAATALGGHTARWAAEDGAEHLLLIDNTAPPAADLVAELGASGVRTSVATLDVADPEALAAAVAAIPAEFPLTAVLHLTAPLAAEAGQLEVARIEREWAATVVGAENLCALGSDRELSALVLGCSVVGVLPSPGLGNQAPAHAYLSALAQECRAGGVPATSVCWGSIDDPDTAVGAAKQLRANGLPALPQRSAAALLRQAVMADTTSVVIADIDWAWMTAHASELGAHRLFDDVSGPSNTPHTHRGR